MPDEFDTDPVAATWHVTVDAKDSLGVPLILLEQDVEWLAEPNVTLWEYGFERWSLFLAGVDPLCPENFSEHLAAGHIHDVRLVARAEDGNGVATATIGPVEVPHGA